MHFVFCVDFNERMETWPAEPKLLYCHTVVLLCQFYAQLYTVIGKDPLTILICWF